MSDSDSILGTSSWGNDSTSESSGFLSSKRGIYMDVVPYVREDLAEELAESNISGKIAYD